METNNRIAFSAKTIIVPAYMAVIAGAEAIGAFIGVVPGALCQAVLTLALLSHYALMHQAPYRRILPVLALAPLLRLLSLAMPIRHLPQIYWHALVGIPLLIGVALTARLLHRSKASLGLCLPSWRSQMLIASSGLPLSIAAFLLLRPQPSVARSDWREIAIGSLILLIFTGFTEELLFRGMLQQVANETLGRAGVVCSSIMFAVVYIGSLSLGYTLFIGLVGLFFGWCVHRTGSIWGVILAHSILSIGMMLVWPFIWG